MKRGAIGCMILSLAVLSFWDSLSILHTVLHHIPNPFHYHGHTHDRTHHSHLTHSHDLRDHIDKGNSKVKEVPAVPVSPSHSYLKEFYKVKWLFSEPVCFPIDLAEREGRAMFPPTVFLPESYSAGPLVPPPEASFSYTKQLL